MRFDHRGGMAPPPVRRSSGRGGCFSNIFASILTCIIIFAIFIAMSNNISCSGSKSSVQSHTQSSTIVREKLDTNNAYINDCIIDEIGWFDNVSKTESQLKKFWEKTGVQPYIILKSYDSSLTTDAQKEQWTIDYYDDNFTTENIFLYVYFAEENTDTDVGYMCYANGLQTSSVMDSEAVEIFWNNIDAYWYTDLSTDDMFINAFSDTAETIMHVSTTGKDIIKWVLIVLAVIISGGVVITLVNKRNKRKKEEAEETQRILETPLADLVDEELKNKYQ